MNTAQDRIWDILEKRLGVVQASRLYNEYAIAVIKGASTGQRSYYFPQLHSDIIRILILEMTMCEASRLLGEMSSGILRQVWLGDETEFLQTQEKKRNQE